MNWGHSAERDLDIRRKEIDSTGTVLGELQPSSLSLLPDITLWGMELGLLTMRRGELARFLFKPPYAYGTLGCPPLIPPNSTVLFEIELIDFLDSAESDKFCALTAVSSGVQMSAIHRERVGFVFLVIIMPCWCSSGPGSTPEAPGWWRRRCSPTSYSALMLALRCGSRC